MTNPGPGIPAHIRLSQQERQKVEQLLGAEITLLGKHWEIINQCLNYKDAGGQAIEGADFVLEFTRFARVGGFISKVAGFLSMADLILGPLGNVLAVIKASVSGRELFSYAGLAYGMTAWAFGQGKPQPSAIRMKNLMASKPQEAALYRQAWFKGVNLITAELEKQCMSGPQAKKALQKLLRGMGENNPKTLNHVIMKSLEGTVRQIGGEAGVRNWQYYNNKYAYPA